MALPGLDQLGVVDLKSMEVTRVLDVPKTPQEVLVRPDGRVAYVSCDASGQVAEIDLADAGEMVAQGRELGEGLKDFNDRVSRLEATGSRTLPGEAAFFLYDTRGLPLEIIEDLAQERGSGRSARR